MKTVDVRRARTLAVTLLAGAACMGDATALRAEQAEVLEEVIVTATRRDARLQDVPLAVSAVTAGDIAAKGFSQYADYLNTLPGVYFQDSGPGRSQIRIRGLSTAEGGVPSTVATYFGETVTSLLTYSGGKPNLRLVDIDRVEVLRGPQGTLFGANALAGVVRIIPAAPDPTDYAFSAGTRGFATAHSDDASLHLEATANLPLIQDRLALRLVGYRDELAGYIDNRYAGRPDLDWTDYGEELIAAFTGQAPGSVTLPAGSLVSPAVPALSRQDINSEDTWGARAALAWLANDQLRFDLAFMRQESTLNSEPFILPAAGAYSQSRGNDYFEQGRYEENIDVASFTARYDWSGVELVAATGWVDYNRFDVSDLSAFASDVYGLPPVPWSQRTPSQSRQFTQEIRLQSSGESALQWTLGMFYLKQNVSAIQSSVDLSCPQCLPTLLTGDAFTFRADASDFFNEKQHALFGEVTYDLSPRWTLGAGARYFEGKLRSGAVVLEGFEVGGALTLPGNRKTDRELNPSAHVRFRPTENQTFYAQAARGFRSGQPNAPLPDACAEEAAAAGIGSLTEPDSLWNYELGSKSTLASGRANLNVALYRADWKGVQLPAGLSCGFGAIVNGGDAVGEGLEVELTARLTDALHLNLSAAYNHNEFDKVAPQTGFENGERLPGSSEKNGSIGLQYDFKVGAAWSGFARADYVHTGNVLLKFGGADETEFVTQDAYDIGNVRIGLQRELGSRGDLLAVELFGRNVTDKRGIASTDDPAQGGKQILIRPREIGLELRYSL